MNSHIIIRALRPRDQTPDEHVQVQNSTGVLRPPPSFPVLSASAACWESLTFSVAKVKTPILWPGSTPPHPLPSGLLLYVRYSLKGQEKWFVSPPLYILSLTPNPCGCLGGDDRAVCSFPPLTPSLPLSPTPSIGHSLTQSLLVTQSVIWHF